MDSSGIVNECDLRLSVSVGATRCCMMMLENSRIFHSFPQLDQRNDYIRMHLARIDTYRKKLSEMRNFN
jgi:hypothetical protein